MVAMGEEDLGRHRPHQVSEIDRHPDQQVVEGEHAGEPVPAHDGHAPHGVRPEQLESLVEVGVGFLALDRALRTLSGGEAQRVALTAALGSSLVDMLYVLDEPSVGLHPADIEPLAAAIEGLNKCGNTVIVVEHEETIIRRADHVVEFGPGAGDEGGRVVFLHKIIPGGADRSYGIHVAQIAGIPKAVTDRANEILEELEGNADFRERQEKIKQSFSGVQMSFLPPESHPLLDELKALDVDSLSPLEALNKLLFQDRGFHGSRGDYYSRANSYLNEVLDDREGLPITLSLLYLELGRQVGLKLVGVALPGHFVVRHEPPDGVAHLVDVYEGGKNMSQREAELRQEPMPHALYVTFPRRLFNRISDPRVAITARTDWRSHGTALGGHAGPPSTTVRSCRGWLT